MMYMKVDYISDTIKGVKRKENQDSLAIIQPEDGFLFFIFDGVGSAKNASLAVKESIKYLNFNYKKYYQNNDFLLKKLMFNLNNHLSSINKVELYTTYVSLYLNTKEAKLKFSSLGDSRLYGISNQYIKQHSKDHKGIISQSITKCLGIKDLAESEFKEIIIDKPEPRLLLSSDGLYSFLEKNKLEYFGILNFSSLKNIKKRIKKEIIDKNHDDASYILINLYV